MDAVFGLFSNLTFFVIMNWLSDIINSAILPKRKKEKRDSIKTKLNYRNSDRDESKLKTATIKTRFASYGNKPSMDKKNKISGSKKSSKISPVIIPNSRKDKKSNSGEFHHFDQFESDALEENTKRTTTKGTFGTEKTGKSEIKSRIPVPQTSSKKDSFKSEYSKFRENSKGSLNDSQFERVHKESKTEQPRVNSNECCQSRNSHKCFRKEKIHSGGTTLKRTPRFVYKTLSNPVHYHTEIETPKVIEFFKETPTKTSEDRQQVSSVFKDEEHKEKFKANRNYFESLSPKSTKRKTITKKVLENFNSTENKNSSKSKNRKDSSSQTEPIPEEKHCETPTTTKKIIETPEYDIVQTKTPIEGKDYEGIQTETVIRGSNSEATQTKTVLEGSNYELSQTKTQVETPNINKTETRTVVETPKYDATETKTVEETPNYDKTETKTVVEGPNYKKVERTTVVECPNYHETSLQEEVSSKTLNYESCQSDMVAKYNQTLEFNFDNDTDNRCSDHIKINDSETSEDLPFEEAQEEQIKAPNIPKTIAQTQNRETSTGKLIIGSLPMESFGPNSIYFIPEEVKGLPVVSYVPMYHIPVILTSGGLFLNQPHNYVLSRLMLRFQPMKNEWQYYGVMPEPLYNHGMIVLDMKVYIIGGKNPSQRVHGSMTPINRVYCLDLMENTWTTKSPMEEARACFGAVTFNGRIYAIGGIGRDGKILDTVESYDPLNDRWTYVKSLPYPCKSMATAAYKTSIFVIGGMTPSPNSEVTSRIIPNVLSYDPTKDEWISKNSLHEPRACATAEIVDNQIWLCNGCKANDNGTINYVQSLATIERFKEDIDLWETMTNLSHSRFSAASATLGSCVFLFGGINSSTKKIDTRMEVVIGETLKNVCLQTRRERNENREVECSPFPFSLTGVQAICIPSLQSRLYQAFQCRIKSYSQN